MSIKLEDIVPKRAEFSLALTGKKYALRPITLEDELWLQDTYGEKLSSILEQIQMKEICQIVFHQMEPESKAEFKKREIKIINEEGDEITEQVGGAKLLFCCVSGHNEKIEIFKALMETIGISRPMIDKLSQVESVKKKAPEKPTGRK